jgi:putative hydrolase of the HAD superfamily
MGKEQHRKYEHLFFDLDHTLWDFEANSRQTLAALYLKMELKNRGIGDFEQFHRTYLLHNEKLWERYRNGFIKVDELRWKRMWLTLLDFGIGDQDLAKSLGVQFLDMLPSRNILFPYTLEILEYLRAKNYRMHLITNGFEITQQNKLKNAGLEKFFEKIITSEASNSIKPRKEIFEYALRVTGAARENSIMIGDSPEVDIQGAINAGMDQVFVNHLRIETDIHPTYTVYSLHELEQIF